MPFIYEDYIDKESVCNAILKMYNYNEETRSTMGNAGRKFIQTHKYTLKDMVREFKKYINTTIENFSKREDYCVTKF